MDNRQQDRLQLPLMVVVGVMKQEVSNLLTRPNNGVLSNHHRVGLTYILGVIPLVLICMPLVFLLLSNVKQVQRGNLGLIMSV